MNYPIGIEMRDEYRSYETSKAAMKMVKDVMLVKENEDVVITSDSSTDMRVVKATANAVYSVGGNPIIINYPTTFKSYQEPWRSISAAVINCDVWIEFSYTTVMHSPCFQKALDNGVRYACFTGMDTIMLQKTIGDVNYPLLVEFGEYMKSRIEKANKIEITCPNGTNLIAYNKGRKVKNSGQLATKRGFPVMLGGQISWCPIEETINGTLVFDAALFPPENLGLLAKPIKLTLENGIVKGIEGSKEAKVFETWLNSFDDKNMYRLAHYSLGFNPGVSKATGRIVEDERIFGCLEMGIGSQGKSIMGSFWNAKAHCDGIVSTPTIILDDVIWEKDGVYMEQETRDFCKKLGVEGYSK